MTSLLVLALCSAWPDSFPSPKDIQLNEATMTERHYDSLDKTTGKRWRAYFSFAPEGAHPSAAQAWAKWKPLLEAKGWKQTREQDGEHFLRRGTSEAKLILADYAEPLALIVEPGTAPRPVVIGKEVPAFGKCEPSGTVEAAVPFTVPSEKGEPTFVADASSQRMFKADPSLSRLELVTSYTAAFVKAGWSVPYQNAEDGIVYAQGPDGWAAVSLREDGTDSDFAITTVRIAADTLGAQLDKDCHVALRGVTFDFNKATLKKGSDTTLDKVKSLLAKRGAFVVEGHTDNVGDAKYNQKLSEQRAQTVMTWLGAHGADKTKLSAKGFGDSQPVADNGYEEGRAKNRRVELRCASRK